MKTSILPMVLLALALPACGAATGEEGRKRLALDIEVNEALTVSHLNSIAGAQTQFQTLGILDADENGAGEYGFITELSGARKLRGPGAGLKFALLGSDFRAVSAAGFVEVHGYLYRIFLPGVGGVPAGEGPGAAGEVDVAGAERHWIGYAWPSRRGVTGQRSFFVDVNGDVWAKDDPELSGAKAPAADAALVEGEGLGRAVRADWVRVD